jgi:hypothetical protein
MSLRCKDALIETRRRRVKDSDPDDVSNRFIFTMRSKSFVDRREFLKTIAAGACVAAAGTAAFAKAVAFLGRSRREKHLTPGGKCSLANTDYCKTCTKWQASPQNITGPVSMQTVCPFR